MARKSRIIEILEREMKELHDAGIISDEDYKMFKDEHEEEGKEPPSSLD